ncbi:MAG: iron dependent repressor, metal binding and dimerization domain protein [Eubacteriales bacterium]|nr:iron dependent repressor, metal binding and dimerization domain protein [Eubacteriales bacterium]
MRSNSFDKRITPGGENYLKVILELSSKGKVCSRDIAEILGVTKASVSGMTQKLKDEGYISKEKYGTVALTTKGIEEATEIQERYNILNSFFRRVLGVDKSTAAKDACFIEHIISSASIKKIDEQLKKFDYIKNQGGNMIIYGPIPSRRLGQSIGINNIPPKTCSYSCVYCQLGRTNKMQIKRQDFYQPEEIYKEIEVKIKQLETKNKKVDYLSFVPDGEPTLDINIGRTIKLLKNFNIKIAVITNASLLWMDEVKEDLMEADWISVSIDSVEENIWRKIDRPHKKLKYDDIINGIIEFSKIFKGTLVTETMMVKAMNDSDVCIEKIAEKIALIKPEKSYILVPTRPPAETCIERASLENLKRAVAIIRGVSGIDVECITGDEEDDGFFFTENIAEDILSIASVHPIREDIVDKILKKRDSHKNILLPLIDSNALVEYEYEGKKFYRRNLQK